MRGTAAQKKIKSVVVVVSSSRCEHVLLRVGAAELDLGAGGVICTRWRRRGEGGVCGENIAGGEGKGRRHELPI